ncbi:MAG: YdeI/OmpD-associated family protein [Ardenticatenaceae bacterium]|nr:YdeI/OmpD-associated family protein [Ardenticatenaceae bacterium]
MESELLTFATAEEWETWLAAHHQEPGGAWLKVGKKGCRHPAIKIAEAGDVAMCYGWIDSQRKGFDQDFFLQRYSPRTSKSPWSKINVERAEALIANGRMQPAGFREIETAKQDGRWAVAYESQRNFTMPEELQTALAQNEPAQTAFTQLNKSEQYTLILPILKATTAQRRADCVQKVVKQLCLPNQD